MVEIDNNMKYWIVILIIIAELLSSCNKIADDYQSSENTLEYYTDTLDLSFLEKDFFYLSIAPSDRSYRHIRVILEKNGEGIEEIRFKNFYQTNSKELTYSYAPYSGNSEIFQEYSGCKVNSKEFADYWYNIFSWMVKNDIIAIGLNGGETSITTNIFEPTYGELISIDATYFDDDYNYMANKYEESGCEIKYRQKIIFLSENTDYKASSILKAIKKRKTLQKKNENVYMHRTLSHNKFRSLDFSTPMCK